MTAPRGLILISILLPMIGAAHAQDRPIGFLTPSKNIVCQFFTDNEQGVLRCDIMNMESRPRRPADCELDWGRAFEMSAKGAAGRICAGDTVMDASLPVLAYGEVWQRGGFTCRSEQTGLTCFNAMQRGFSLARAEQRLF
ncbi:MULTISPECIES: DUF6636 domain-containing protein [unclassified Bradyrhizobium]|uniref:DUF6636 domain-containing protein n=1 Tax=unclassified Bradyrhizobium TaxID=2631580 RepID=UPI0008F3A896|nr:MULTISPECIES: DUF6636 domain-containing protein [unclassified Bradyrhizobium]MBB4380085.1 hypothetical protein [Bradyrhizobium sp. SBR1B]MBB4398274.1 hypothetical protein [Bradyrhizobium sp. ERR14]SFM78345.1 hypothetical protein SAMN05216573_104238 [Bradyrhizobium sp. Rc3b]